MPFDAIAARHLGVVLLCGLPPDALVRLATSRWLRMPTWPLRTIV